MSPRSARPDPGEPAVNLVERLRVAATDEPTVDLVPALANDTRSAEWATHAAGIQPLVERLDLLAYEARTIAAIIDEAFAAKRLLDHNEPAAIEQIRAIRLHTERWEHHRTGSGA